jgi:hypothetical protein
LNPAGSEPWVIAIGRFILNFGAVEAQTYFWLLQLRDVTELPEADTAAPFAPRARAIKQLVALTGFAPQDIERADELWDIAVEHARFRNRVAHNPIFFGWHSPDESGPPDFMTVVDLGHGLRPDYTGDASISLTTLNAQVDAVAQLARGLYELYRLFWPGDPQDNA